MHNLTPKHIKHILRKSFSDFQENSEEFRVNSIFTKDDKYKLYINKDTGLWICFKSRERGNIFQLLALLRSTTYKEAQVWAYSDLLGYSKKDLLEIIGGQSEASSKASEAPDLGDMFHNLHLYKLNESIRFHSSSLAFYTTEYLEKKRILDTLEDHPLYLCLSGDYKDRIIIPFIKKDKMVFFQARAIYPKEIKFLTPKVETYKIKSSWVLYPYDVTKDVYVCEGPMDARILQIQGINATSIQGSAISFIQAKELLRSSEKFGTNIILSFDNDEAGEQARKLSYRMLVGKLGLPIRNIFYDSPPKEYKDWSEAYAASAKIDFNPRSFDNMQDLTDKLLNHE